MTILNSEKVKKFQAKTNLGAFAYSIKTEGNIIKHVKINKTLNNKFQLDQPDENGTGVAKQFDNLEELVDHYKEFGMVDTATSLIRPDTPGQIYFHSGQNWYVRAEYFRPVFFISVSFFLNIVYSGGIL